MKLKWILGLNIFVLLMTFPIFAANDKKAAPNTKKYVDRPGKYYWREAIPFLKFEQIAKMEYWTRVRYVKEFRKTLLSLSDIQKKYGIKTAELEALQKDPALWAFLVGDTAYAEDTHGRGAWTSDHCIDLMDVGDYDRRYPEGRGGYKCKLQATCTGHLGPGRECGYVGTGLNQYCVPLSMTQEGSKFCMEKKNDFVLKNETEIEAKILAFEEAAKKNAGKSIKSLDAMVKDLADNFAYDDRVFAHLIWAAQKYAEEKKVMPGPHDLAKGWDGQQNMVDHTFAALRDTCNSRLSVETQRQVEKNVTAGRFGGHFMEMETAAFGRLKDKTVDSGYAVSKEITIATIFQPDQCRLVNERYLNAYTEFDRLKRTMGGEEPVTKVAIGKNLSNEQVAPGAENEDAGVLYARDPAAVDQAYGNNTVPTGKSASFGCSEVDPEQLREPIMACAKCLFDKSVLTSNSSLKGKYSNGGASNKWLALMSTMMYACGKNKFPTHFTLEDVIDFTAGMGHCSNETYSWDNSDNFRKEIINWQTGTQGVESRSDKSIFSKVYGADYDELKSAICGGNLDGAGSSGGNSNVIYDVTPGGRLAPSYGPGKMGHPGRPAAKKIRSTNENGKRLQACIDEAKEVRKLNAGPACYVKTTNHLAVYKAAEKALMSNAADRSDVMPVLTSDTGPGGAPQECFTSHSATNKGNNEINVQFRSAHDWTRDANPAAIDVTVRKDGTAAYETMPNGFQLTGYYTFDEALCKQADRNLPQQVRPGSADTAEKDLPVIQPKTPWYKKIFTGKKGMKFQSRSCLGYECATHACSSFPYSDKCSMHILKERCRRGHVESCNDYDKMAEPFRNEEEFKTNH